MTTNNRNEPSVEADDDTMDELTAEHATLMSRVGAELSESKEAIDTLSRGAADANTSSSETATLADTAQESAHDAFNDVDEAQAAAEEATEKLETLKDTVEEIDEITAILNEIADQTNLLALNASIEAARVGEKGDGFAVVAEEVKQLAEQAQQQATEIESIVDEVRADAEGTIEQILTVDDKTNRAAESITETVGDLDDIANSAVETSSSIDEMATTTQDYADDLEGIAGMIIDAISQARELDEMTDERSE